MANCHEYVCVCVGSVCVRHVALIRIRHVGLLCLLSCTGIKLYGRKRVKLRVTSDVDVAIGSSRSNSNTCGINFSPPPPTAHSSLALLCTLLLFLRLFTPPCVQINAEYAQHSPVILFPATPCLPSCQRHQFGKQKPNIKSLKMPVRACLPGQTAASAFSGLPCLPRRALRLTWRIEISEISAQPTGLTSISVPPLVCLPVSGLWAELYAMYALPELALPCAHPPFWHFDTGLAFS